MIGPMSTITLPHAAGTTTAVPASRHIGRVRRFLRGPDTDPRWARPALFVLLGATALLYLWGLGASGWANSYYSAAVQAATTSWKAFFFGSFDASNFITVDKAPGAIWVMALFARVFGVNAWSILVPQALEGVAVVAVLYATVRRWFGPGPALLAGAVAASTPAAALIFRFNNPDALLVLLLTIGAYALTRALEKGQTGWVVLAGSMIGFGFLAKMLQALVLVPVFGLVYLVAGPPGLGKRFLQLTASLGALLVSAGWWIVAVQLTPASARPYIGGSQDNSLWNLIFGYNGFGRLTGNEAGSVGGGGNAGSQWGATGWSRLFNAQFGGQASWLIPAALILLVGGLAVTWRGRRTNRARAALMLWGGWLVVTATVISFGRGIIHPYYAVALAPAIGAVVGIGGACLWRHRSHVSARIGLAGAVAAGSGWSYVLLARRATWLPGLRSVVLAAGISAAVALILCTAGRGRLLAAVAAAGVVAALTGPAAYAVATAATPHTGAIPGVGPAGLAGGGFGGGPPGGGVARTGGPATGVPAGGAAVGGPAPGGAGTAAGRGGAGGLLTGSAPSATLTATLDRDATSYTWVAATVGANQAAGYQLATGDAVMAIGGFNGTDPTPTLAQFQAYVRVGKVHWFIAGGRGGGGGGPGRGGNEASTASGITAWVGSTFTAQTVGGVTLYDLSTGAGP
ncbi:MAG: hypothetical protein QOD63_2302 [Actinomycetota bacterium]|nr:hypothetical protein [Actinomycetota bacterium]